MINMLDGQTLIFYHMDVVWPMIIMKRKIIQTIGDVTYYFRI